VSASTLDFAGVERFLLFGGGRQLLDLADLLGEAGREVAVVTGARHLGEEIAPGERLGAALRGRGLRVAECRSLDQPEVEGLLAGSMAGVSLGAPWIFRPDFIGRFEGRLLNLHSTPLPRFRGGASFSWMILSGVRAGASVLHQVEAGLDTGPVVLRRDFEYPGSCRIPRDYIARTAAVDRELLADFTARLGAGEAFPLRPQDHAASTYFPRLHTPTHGHVDWSWSAEEIERFVCAFDAPYPGAATSLDGRLVRLSGCRRVDAETHHPFLSGIVVRVHEGVSFVAASGGTLAFDRLADQDGRPVLPAPGRRLRTPAPLLEAARGARIVYDADGPSGGQDA